MENDVFVIASNVEFEDPLELDLHNLKVRLKIQMDMVERTKAEIEAIEKMLSR